MAQRNKTTKKTAPPRLDPALVKIFRNKTILVTGGTGSIGSQLVLELLNYNPKQIRIFSRDESKQYYLMEKINHHAGVRLFIGDIRDRERLDMAMQNVDVVFHAAALKHVPLCEYNPFEAVKTNIVGSQNVIESALKHNVDKVIAISTDKAANPSNVMGTSKLMMEKLVTNANFYRGNARTKFSCVRFGNVAWARGSVLPLWRKQVEREQRIHVTDHDMTRFFMSIDQAVKLVVKTAQYASGGEIFILKMPSIKLRDLARLFIEKYFPKETIAIEEIGIRPGEKLHEELMSDNVKTKGVFENSDMIIILPEVNIYELKQPDRKYPGFRTRTSTRPYTSQNSINHGRIRRIL